MRLNEMTAHPFEGSFEEFYNYALEQNKQEIINKNGYNRSKDTSKFKELYGFRILDNAIVHVDKGHILSPEQWNIIIKALSENNFTRCATAKKAKFCGKPIIYEIEYDNHLYGILVEYFKKALPIVITAFEGTRNGLDDWFAKNELYKRKVRQDEAHSLRYRNRNASRSDSNNIINENDKNVNPFIKLNEEIAYHGTDKQFDKFDKSYIYTDYAELGYGFYFDTDISNAESYGDKIFKVKLTYKNPFILSKSTYNWLAENLGENKIDFKPEVEDLIKLISVDTLRATDIIQSKYDAIIADTQIVVFEPEQIEILEKIEETLSIKQIVERMEEFEEVQVLNQKELINALYKSKIEYRITYDANKNWFLIATAYNHTHEELLYNAAPAYGLNFNQMVDYYNDHYADLFDLIYTPKTENIKVGFDHNNIAYIFNNFGTIYTKGQELSKNLLNDLTDRFGKPNIKRLEESLHENLNDNFYQWFDESKAKDVDEVFLTKILAELTTRLNNRKSYMQETLTKNDLDKWISSQPTNGEKIREIFNAQKELQRLTTLDRELGNINSRLSYKYRKQGCYKPHNEWDTPDRLQFESNTKKKVELRKQIEELKEVIKRLRDYQPAQQMSLFSEDVKTNLNQAFWDWFGDSITVDKDGNPLIFYHGTRSDFTEFKTNYADNLVFFSYKKDFADRWGKEKRDYSNEISNDIFDKQDEFKRKLYKEYQAKYGEDFYDNDEYRKELNKELDDNLAKLEKERNVHNRTLGCYLKVHKIFYPEKDYELVLDEICKYYGWQNPNTKEYEEKLKRFEDEYDKANEYWNQWWANNKDADEETIKAEEKKLDNAFKRYSVCKSIKTEFEDNLNRIKKGAWVYFEHGNVIDKIWSLGYDAIQLSERDGEQTTLAVRAGNNQIKSVDNNGTWSKTSENIYEHLNRMFEELL